MDGTTHTTSAKKISMLDLEQPITDSKAAARIVAIIVDEILSSHHRSVTTPKGTTALMLDDSTIEALNHSITNLLSHTRKASDAFYAVHAAATA